MTTSVSNLSESVKALIIRLRRGQRWLTEEHRSWMADDSRAASDEAFSAALAGWDQIERVLRCSVYTGCIWGVNRSCPQDAPVRCGGCVFGPQRPSW